MIRVTIETSRGEHLQGDVTSRSDADDGDMEGYCAADAMIDHDSCSASFLEDNALAFVERIADHMEKRGYSAYPDFWKQAAALAESHFREQKANEDALMPPEEPA
jgi:hypothetical protein